MPRHIFVKPDIQRIPIPGDLIRNSVNSPNYINIVLDVSSRITDATGEFVAIRSVRYGATNFHNFKLLDGKRSRSFKYYLSAQPAFATWAYAYVPPLNDWEVVEEFVIADNTRLRSDIVNQLRDVDTAWRPRNAI